MVDRADDQKIGIRTSAILFGSYDVLVVMLCQMGFIVIMFTLGMVHGRGLWYFAGLALAAVLAWRQYFWIRHRDPKSCFKAFLHNNWVGGAVFAGVLFDTI